MPSFNEEWLLKQIETAEAVANGKPPQNRLLRGGDLPAFPDCGPDQAKAMLVCLEELRNAIHKFYQGSDRSSYRVAASLYKVIDAAFSLSAERTEIILLNSMADLYIAGFNRRESLAAGRAKGASAVSDEAAETHRIWRQEAERIWASKPHLSASSLSKLVVNALGLAVKPATVAKRIKHLKPRLPKQV